MQILNIKKPGACKYDLVALGEVMLRLDPGEGRVRTTRNFRVWEGGGEYNVARGLRRCFGLKTAICTALADNDVGRLLEDCILQGGVDTEFLKWAPFDGVGRTVRNGLNFTERGFGARGAVGISDRGHTAASQLKRGDFDWERIFGQAGTRWFHTGGIFAGLSQSTAELVLEAVRAAHEHGVVVSYDLNYRPSLWKGIGGVERARAVNREVAKEVDVMLGNEEDFTACLGLEVEGLDEAISTIEVEAFKRMIEKAAKAFPNFEVVATTLRTVKSATRNDWGAICWAGGEFHEAPPRRDLEILDRVGGGDSFASGLIYGLLQFNDAQKAVEYGAAHGALAVTTPGDTSMASLKEVEALVRGAGARVQR
jgi:2-dehydro-3-deoxygluconokinase